MRPLIARGHLSLGVLYERVGTRAISRGHLATAAAMFREMGMPYWLEQTEASLRRAL